MGRTCDHELSTKVVTDIEAGDAPRSAAHVQCQKDLFAVDCSLIGLPVIETASRRSGGLTLTLSARPIKSPRDAQIRIDGWLKQAQAAGDGALCEERQLLAACIRRPECRDRISAKLDRVATKFLSEVSREAVHTLAVAHQQSYTRSDSRCGLAAKVLFGQSTEERGARQRQPTL